MERKLKLKLSTKWETKTQSNPIPSQFHSIEELCIFPLQSLWIDESKEIQFPSCPSAQASSLWTSSFSNNLLLLLQSHSTKSTPISIFLLISSLHRDSFPINPLYKLISLTETYEKSLREGMYMYISMIYVYIIDYTLLNSVHFNYISPLS